MLAIGSNLLIVLILRRPKMRNHTIYLYMTVLALADMFHTAIGLLGRLWIGAISNYAEFNKNAILCKFWFYSYYFSESSSDWTLACMSCERCLAVLAPLKSRVLMSTRSSMIILAVIHVALLAVFTNVFHYFGITTYNQCTALEESMDAADIFRQWVNPIVIVYIPSLIIFICNIIIVVVLVRARILRKQLSSSTSQTEQDNFRSTISMLLSVSVVFVILKAPRQVFGASNLSRTFAYHLATHEQARVRLIWALTVWMGSFNHCVNFFVYVISGQVFRQELRMSMQQWRFWKQEKQQQKSRVNEGEGSSSMETVWSVCESSSVTAPTHKA